MKKSLSIVHKVCDKFSMSRRSQDPGDEFSFSDLAIGAAITKRQVQQLSDAGLLPKGSDIKALKRTAVIGAFHTAGAPLLMAGRLAEAILNEFNQYDGEVPSGLINLDHKLPRETIEWLCEQVDINDYWRHRAGLRHPDIYRRGEALRNDALISVVDRSLFFHGNRSGPIGSGVAGKTFEFVFGGWIEGWERGGIAQVIPMSHRIKISSEDDGWELEIARLEREAQRVRENAIGTLIVNVSLAVRTALDRLAARRAN
jgi:hypothetical protein